MISIFAKTFMTATGHNGVRVRDVRPNTMSKQRWLPSGHWFLDDTKVIDPTKL